SHRGSGFDPTGLERAAKAAKLLDASPYARQALELTRQQEQTRQLEYQVKVEEYQTYQKQMGLQHIAKEAEEARKTLQAQTEHAKNQAHYRDKLERQRHVDELNARNCSPPRLSARRRRRRRRQEELVRRQEAIKRKTLEYEAELRQQTELARVKAETEGRIRQERENHDLRVEQARVEAEEQRATVLEAIQLAGETVGGGVQSFLRDREQARPPPAGRGGGRSTPPPPADRSPPLPSRVAGRGWRHLEARLGKPALVRETSRRSLLGAARRPWAAAAAALRRWRGRGAQDALRGVVLEPGLDARLRSVAAATFHTRRNNAPFRHLLLHGPPGTGKTLFAKGLARHSGLEYAILTGGDVAPLGRDAVTELHKLFDWAEASQKGLLLFVDEADAFLRKRSTEHISEDLRNALNAFLYRTGEATGKFMLVYASNQPDQFDWAVNDRIDEMVEFRLPGLDERRKMINMYLKKYLIDQEGAGRRAKTIMVHGIEDKDIEDVARRTENFSGREISKLAIAWQAAAYGSDGAEFTPDMMRAV
ncbi:unnamed protein product, partial [Heterosigma akashiwo]